MKQLCKIALVCVAAAGSLASCKETPEETAKYAVNFAADPAAVGIVEVTVNGGKITSGAQVKEGAMVSVKAILNATGHEFEKWESADVTFGDQTAQQTTFTMPGKDVSLTAKFKSNEAATNPLTFTAQDENGNKVAVNVNDAAFASGDDVVAGATVSIKATAATGWAFKKWEGATFENAADAENPETTFTMPDSAVALVATFEPTAPPTYTITFEPQDANGNKIEVTANGASVASGDAFEAGTNISIVATPATNYAFDGWNGVTLTNRLQASASFQMPANDVILTAEFGLIPTYELTFVAQDANGNKIDVALLSGTPVASGDFLKGETLLQISATPAAGYNFAGWTGADFSFQNATSLITATPMPRKAATLGANFEEASAATYKVNFTATSTSGTVVVKVNNIAIASGDQVPEGTNVQVTQTVPGNNYSFSGWTGNNITYVNRFSTSTTFVMPAQDVTVVADVFANGYTDGYVEVNGTKWTPRNPSNIGTGLGALQNVQANIWWFQYGYAQGWTFSYSYSAPYTVSVGNGTVFWTESTGGWREGDATDGAIIDYVTNPWTTTGTVCPAGYALPTKAQWADLFNPAYTTLVADSGARGMERGLLIKVNGTDKAIFLPYVGAIVGSVGKPENGATANPDKSEGAVYWAADGIAWDGSGDAQAYAVTIGKTITAPAAAPVARRTLATVRCVKL